MAIMTLSEAIVYLLDEFHLGDKIYDVRSRAVDTDRAYVGKSWDHPAVKKFNDAVAALEDARAEKDQL